MLQQKVVVFGPWMRAQAPLLVLSRLKHLNGILDVNVITRRNTHVRPCKLGLDISTYVPIT